MATAYHMEALRKQRVLERAVEARHRKQEKEEEAYARTDQEEKEKKRKHHRHHHQHKRSTRPASAQKISSSPKKSKTVHSPSASGGKPYEMDTSPSPVKIASPKATNCSKRSSQCSSASKSDSHNSRHSSASVSSKKQSSGDVTASQSHAGTVTVSRCSKCRSLVDPTSRSQSRSTCSSRSSVSTTPEPGSSKKTTSVMSVSRLSSTTGSRRTSLEKMAEIKADAVRKDLHQQELVLRDSNLVMGTIPVEEEMTLRALERQKLDATT